MSDIDMGKSFLHFLQYHNALPIAFGIMFLGGAGAFAATNPQAVYSADTQVVAIDNTYIVGKNLATYSPQVIITGVTENDDSFFVSYDFSTIDVADGAWRDVVKNGVLQVDKSVLGKTIDLGVYATKQLSQLIDSEHARLEESQDAEKRNVHPKTVATVYGGLVGKFLNDSVETLPGYTPVVTPPAPDLSHNNPVVAGQTAAVVSTTQPTVTRDEVISIVKQQLAQYTSPTASAGGSSAAPPPTSGASSPPAPTNAASLTINGADPSQWQLGAAWQDNLGALFTHANMTETVYSTTTVDTGVVGTTTIDYWATWYPDPSATTNAQTLHATRDVVVVDPNAAQANTADSASTTDPGQTSESPAPPTDSGTTTPDTTTATTTAP